LLMYLQFVAGGSSSSSSRTELLMVHKTRVHYATGAGATAASTSRRSADAAADILQACLQALQQLQAVQQHQEVTFLSQRHLPTMHCYDVAMLPLGTTLYGPVHAYFAAA
jgi:hypothetical protein